VWLCEPNIINSCYHELGWFIIKDGHTPYNITGAELMATIDETKQKIKDGTLDPADIPEVIDMLTKDAQSTAAREIVESLHKVFTTGRMVGICETIKEFSDHMGIDKDDDPDANVNYGGTA
jgi:hypothetical protein